MFEWQEQYLVIVPGCGGRIENTRTLSQLRVHLNFFNTENVPRYKKKNGKNYLSNRIKTYSTANFLGK